MQRVILKFSSFSRNGNFSTLIVGGFGAFFSRSALWREKRASLGRSAFFEGRGKGNMCRFVSGIRKNLVYKAFRGGKSGLKPYVSRD